MAARELRLVVLIVAAIATSCSSSTPSSTVETEPPTPVVAASRECVRAKASTG